MKTSIKIAFASTSLALGLVAPVLCAQNEPPPPPPPGECSGGFSKSPQDNFLVILADELSLTQEQLPKVKAILDDEKTAMDTLRKNNVTDRETIHAKIDAIIKAHREQIRALLTADQQKIFDQMKPAGRNGPPPGSPPPGDN